MSDDCDCPACQPQCEKTKRKCFIPCPQCNKPEEDDHGELKSRTRRVNYAMKNLRGDESI
jgi:hypothetical protein